MSTYLRIIEHVFSERYRPGDVLYFFRSRKAFPKSVAVKVVQERHYRLVPASDVTPEDLLRYRNSA